MTAAPPPTDRPSSIRLLALGDSYTIGEGVAPEARWPARLAALLRAMPTAVSEPVLIAQTGWTTAELSAAIDAARPPRDFDLVTLLIGVNNQYRGMSAASYRGEFDDLLRRAIGFAGERTGRVTVVSIPDWSVTPFAEGRDRVRIAMEIDEFNSINRAASSGAGAQYVDVTTSSRRAARDPSLLATDGLHPSGRMYDEWARLILPVAAAALSS